MSFRRPPRLAVWLLQRSGVATNEPLAGDLLEEFRRGRSVGWFWRQTGTAVLNTFVKGLRAERLDILAWVLGGCAETAAFVIAMTLFHLPFGLLAAAYTGAVLGAMAFALYLEFMIRLRLNHRPDLNDKEEEALFRRHIKIRVKFLGSSIAFLLIDCAVYGVALLGNAGVRLLHLQPSPWMWMDIVQIHAIGLVINIVQLAMEAAGPESQNS